jgi:hypothetical protein
VHGELYKRIPRGHVVSPDGERFLLHNALWAGHEEPLPDVVHSADFVDYCRTHWKNLAPLHRWLVDNTRN